MKLYRTSIPAKTGLPIEEETGDYSREELGDAYPLLGLLKTAIHGRFEKSGDIVTFRGLISGTAIYADARTSEPFEEKLSVDGVIDLLEDFSAEGDGYVFPGNGLDTRDIVLAVLRSETPIKPLMPGSATLGDDEVLVYSLEEEGEAEEATHSSPFDVLADYPLEDK